ncbi:MAG: hypothetical protein L0Y73_00660 [Candidatus Aminicenantes bacterium]|nr:hypothetical protein [Candidatus Aminicenantes bacterium]
MEPKTIFDGKKDNHSTSPGKMKFIKNKRPLIYFIAALILIVIAGYLLFREKFSGGGSPQLRQMQDVVNKVRSLETDIQENQDEIFSLMREYKEKTGEELPAGNFLNLTEEEQRILEQKIKEEQDVSIKALLDDILEKNSEIDGLKSEIEKLEKLLPAPHVVQIGENHFQIAMDFLLNEKNIEKEKALELIERSLLFDPLVPGFKVWNFYDGEEYGTFITQGSADISPNEVGRRSKKKLVDARDQAIAERDKLAQDIEILENRRMEIVSQLEILNLEKQKLIAQISDLNKDNLALQKTVSSLFYVIDLQKNLKKRGIIKSGFLKSTKVKNFSPAIFDRSLDLRAEDTIKITAADFNRSKIKGIALYPVYYKKGIDYKIVMNQNKSEAELVILDTAKLKNERVIISIE